MNYKKKISEIKSEAKRAKLVIVTKNQQINNIQTIYNLGERHFGENRVQELLNKHKQLPKDIKWHMIGHLQTNKVKFIIPFIYLIQSVDSMKLLKKINSSALIHKRKVNCLLQIKISNDKSKFGFESKEVIQILKSNYKSEFPNINIRGVMGMSSLTSNTDQIKCEFESISQILNLLNSKNKILSIGMSNDYKIAHEAGSNMIRIGSYIFKE